MRGRQGGIAFHALVEPIGQQLGIQGDLGDRDRFGWPTGSGLVAGVWQPDYYAAD